MYYLLRRITLNFNFFLYKTIQKYGVNRSSLMKGLGLWYWNGLMYFPLFPMWLIDLDLEQCSFGTHKIK